MKLASALTVCLLLTSIPAISQQREQDRVTESGLVLRDILAMPAGGIPRGLINNAACVIVFPSVKKAAFVVGASYGRGVVTCRTGKNYSGPWSAPAMYALEGGSFGLQIGGQATDFVILVMNDRGARSIMSSKVKLGGDASIAAGPLGRTASAETDIVMQAQMLSYSRAQGVFAGISLAGSTLRSDGGANRNLYGKDVTARQIIFGGAVKAPPSAAGLLNQLNTISPHHTENPANPPKATTKEEPKPTKK